jgi:hypothetical protein
MRVQIQLFFHPKDNVLVLPAVESAYAPVPDVDVAAYALRPIQVLRVGELVTGCTVHNRSKDDSFQFPEGVPFALLRRETRLDEGQHVYTFLRQT